jgi:stage II sporulation protein D
MRRAPALLAALAALAATPPARGEELIRVVVAEGVARVSLAGDGLALRQPDEEGAGRRVAGPLEIEASGGALRVGGQAWPGPVEVAGAGPIRMGERALSPVVQIEPGPGGLTVIEELPLDDYVAGVVSGELPRAFPLEAQKAQAVAARTYALVKKIEAEASGRPWHLGANVLSQVYAGAAPNPVARAAADATRGEVLVMGNEPVEAFFHSTCGGRTESGLEALGRDLPYLASVPCGSCNDAPHVRWSLALRGAELGRLLGLSGPVSAARVVERTASGRVARVEVEVAGKALVLQAADLRQRLGWARLPSLAFELRGRKGTITFDGRGQGHGAGLCQWGAAGMARQGKGYREILRRYYPGTEVVKMY